MHRSPATRGPVIGEATIFVTREDRADAVNEAHNLRDYGRHTTPEPFPTWFKIFFAVSVGGLALLVAVVVAVLSVI
jgi:hypothetical protein